MPTYLVAFHLNLFVLLFVSPQTNNAGAIIKALCMSTDLAVFRFNLFVMSIVSPQTQNAGACINLDESLGEVTSLNSDSNHLSACTKNRSLENLLSFIPCNAFYARVSPNRDRHHGDQSRDAWCALNRARGGDAYAQLCVHVLYGDDGHGPCLRDAGDDARRSDDWIRDGEMHPTRGRDFAPHGDACAYADDREGGLNFCYHRDWVEQKICDPWAYQRQSSNKCKKNDHVHEGFNTISDPKE